MEGEPPLEIDPYRRILPKPEAMRKGCASGFWRSACDRGGGDHFARDDPGPRHVDSCPRTGGSKVGQRWVKSGVRAPFQGTNTGSVRPTKSRYSPRFPIATGVTTSP